MPDKLPDNLRKVASVPHHDLFVADADDILIVLPEAGFKDTAAASRVTAAALQDYARKLGRKCGLVILANNLLGQEPESRRVYAENVIPELFYGITMVVTNPIPRIIGSMALRLRTLRVPLILVDNVESGIAWLEARRTQENSSVSAGMATD